MSDHDPLCRAQHMAVETDIDDLEGCDCALIADLRERIAQEIERYDAEVCDLLGAPCTCAQAARIARGTP